MKRIIMGMVAVMSALTLSAQNSIDAALGVIEKNNTTLKALRETADAQKLDNRTDIFLPDPEVGFTYQWGNPSAIGSKQNYSFTQSFDIATLFGLKGNVARHNNRLVDLQYKADRMNVLLEAKNYCLDLIYYNALMRELAIRLDHAKTIASAQKRRFEAGEGNVLEYNNAKLNLSNVKGEMTRVETERKGVVSQLTRLNGGEELSYGDTVFPAIQIPQDFMQWYAMAEEKSPVLSYAKQDIELKKREVALSKSEGLPSFSVGYAGEVVVGQSYHGVSVGMSIPLWSNRNNVKQAKNAVRAAESRQTDARQQLMSRLEILYARTVGLKAVADNYRESLSNANNSTLLKKALDAGQISMLDYVVEIGLYYDIVNQALQAELDYQKAYAELSAFEL